MKPDHAGTVEQSLDSPERMAVHSTVIRAIALAARRLDCDRSSTETDWRTAQDAHG